MYFLSLRHYPTHTHTQGQLFLFSPSLTIVTMSLSNPDGAYHILFTMTSNRFFFLPHPTYDYFFALTSSYVVYTRPPNYSFIKYNFVFTLNDAQFLSHNVSPSPFSNLSNHTLCYFTKFSPISFVH